MGVQARSFEIKTWHHDLDMCVGRRRTRPLWITIFVHRCYRAHGFSINSTRASWHAASCRRADIGSASSAAQAMTSSKKISTYTWVRERLNICLGLRWRWFDHMTEELHGETCSRNVARCARGEASRGGGKGAASSSLQITTDKEASEIKKLRSDQSTDKGSGRQGAKSSS